MYLCKEPHKLKLIDGSNNISLFPRHNNLFHSLYWRISSIQMGIQRLPKANENIDLLSSIKGDLFRTAPCGSHIDILSQIFLNIFTYPFFLSYGAFLWV